MYRIDVEFEPELFWYWPWTLPEMQDLELKSTGVCALIQYYAIYLSEKGP